MDVMKEMNTGKPIKAVEHILKRRLGSIGVAIVSLAYLFWGFFVLKEKDATWLELVISGGLTVIVAFSIDTLLRWQGLTDGGLDMDVQSAQKGHRDQVLTTVPYFTYADNWADEENANVLKKARTHILAQTGLRYSDFFEEDGKMKGTEIPKPENTAPKYVRKRYKEQITAFNRAVKFKITPVTLTKITSDTGNTLDENYLGRTVGEYTSTKAKVVAIGKVTGFAVFAKVAFDIVENPGWESFYYGLLQVALFFMFGLLSYYFSYTFMTGEYRSGLLKKTMLLARLVAYGKQKERDVDGNNEQC